MKTKNIKRTKTITRMARSRLDMRHVKARPCHGKSGLGLLEAVVGVSVMSFIVFSLMLVLQMSNKIITETSKSAQASFLLEEGMEAVKIIRDTSWQNNINPLSVNTDYYFNFDGTTWKSTTTNVYIDGFFERKFKLESVYRNVGDDIAVSGTLDSGSKKTTVSVSWRDRNGTTTKSLSSYITNLFNN